MRTRLLVLGALLLVLPLAFAGVAAAQDEEDGTGTLVFRHDLDEPATVAVGILYQGETEERQLGTVPDNDARGFPARAGTHLLAVYDPDGTQLLRGYEVTITAGQQTSVSASDLLGGEGESDDSDADAGLLIFYNDGSADLTLKAVEVASGDRIDIDVQLDAGNSGQVMLPAGEIRVLAYRADDGVFVGEAIVTITSGGRAGLDASDLVINDESDDQDDDDEGGEIRTPTRVDTGAGGTAGTGAAAVVVPVLLAAGAALAGSRAVRRAA